MSGVQIIGLDECRRDLRALAGDLVDGRQVLREFFNVWSYRMGQAWNNVKATGGVFRGVQWAGMKPQYTRKDGTVVPAWGGVARAAKGHGLKRKGGSVKGKLRPSKQRVKQSSVMMKDTHALFRDITQKWLALTKEYIEVGTSSEYGAVQDERRPILFWQLPKDVDILNAGYEAHIDRAIKKRGFE